VISGIVSVAGWSSPSRGGKEREMVASGKVGCRPMGRAAEGLIERAERDKEETSKVRQWFGKENNH
jgi:hypothetical protein